MEQLNCSLIRILLSFDTDLVIKYSIGTFRLPFKTAGNVETDLRVDKLRLKLLS